MKIIQILALCSALIGAASAAVVGQKDRMKFAFNMSPEFSHIRDVVAPQNVDIIETVKPSKHVVKPVVHPGQGFAIGLPATNQKTSNTGSGIPIKIPAVASVGGVSSHKVGQDSKGIQSIGPNTSKPKFTLQKPQFIGSPVRKVIPRPNIQSKPTSQLTNDRMVNQMMENSQPIVSKPTRTNRNRGCNFNIPSFLLPDMSVTQKEFEQRYLLPALRAHLTMKACRSRALTVYIDWLLYLRLRNFNV